MYSNETNMFFFFTYLLRYILYPWTSLSSSGGIKNQPAMQETQVWSLRWEDPLEKEMATHSSMLAWESHGQRSLAGYSPWSHKSRTWLKQLNHHHLQWASMVAQTAKNLPAKCRRPSFDLWVRKIPWKREQQPTFSWSFNIRLSKLIEWIHRASRVVNTPKF